MIPTGELAGRLGLNAVDNSSATDWYFTTEVLPATPEDNVRFRFDISDLAGNVVTGFNSTLNNSSVRVDKTPPLVSGITLVTSNDNGSWAKAGDNLTLEFITDEEVSTPSILIAANSRLADNRSLDGKQWETIYEVLPGDNGTVNWDFNVRDLAGNVSNNVTQDNASLIIMDTTSPEVQDVVFLSKGGNPSFARSGDELELNFTTSETVREVRIRLNDNEHLGASASYSDNVQKDWSLSLIHISEPTRPY